MCGPSDGWTTAGKTGRRATSAEPAGPAPAGRATPAGETGRRATPAVLPAGLALAGGSLWALAGRQPVAFFTYSGDENDVSATADR